jgi:hypothetical protein
MTKATCNICANELESCNIKECPFCLEKACINCIKHYTLDTKSTEKKCMFCTRVFTRAILVKLLGNAYIEGKIFKDQIKELLFQEEKTLIPQTLPIIEHRKLIKNSIQYIKNLESERLNKIRKNEIIKDTIDDFKVLGNIYAHRLYLTSLTSKKIDIKKYKYKYPCANNQCNGFVNENWKCDLCEKTTCKHCFIIKEEQHECNEEDIATATLIRSNSKPCPKCNISIIKSDGCDQMWCVNCHTTFDWKTLKIKTSGVVHNPEYFRYMRENGIQIQRNPNDDPCVNIYDRAFNKLAAINTKMKKIGFVCNWHLNMNFMFELYRSINHISEWEMEKLRSIITNHTDWSKEERIKYLEKTIDEKQYKINLARKYKSNEFVKEITSLQETIIQVCKYTFINIVDEFEEKFNQIDLKKKEKSDDIYDIKTCQKIIKLKEFINDMYSCRDELRSVYSLINRDIIVPSLLK